MERGSRGHPGSPSETSWEVPVSTSRRRWRTVAAGFAIALASVTTAGCGSDVVDDDVQQDVEEGVDDVEREVEDATDGEDGEDG
jgi:hypothetical protein